MSSKISRFHLTRVESFVVTQEVPKVPKRKDEKRREKLISSFYGIFVQLGRFGSRWPVSPPTYVPGGQVPLEAFRSLISLSDRRRGTYCATVDILLPKTARADRL